MKTAPILAALLAAFAIAAHGQENATQVYLKTATYSITKQVKQADGTLKTITVARTPSLWEAIQKLKTLPVGDYRIAQPSPYVKVMPCALPHGSSGICLDNLDARLLTFSAIPPAP